MKFPNIAIGGRFLIGNERYTKVGPLTARRESDGQVRMISRSSAVTPERTDAPPTARSEATPPTWLSKALAAYEQTLVARLAPAGCEARQRAALDAAIVQARDAFERAASNATG